MNLKITCLTLLVVFSIGCSNSKGNDYIWSGVDDKSEVMTLCNDDCDFYFSCSNDESMKPTFSCQNKLYLSKPKRTELHIGDIVLFFSANQEGYPDFTVHRIVDVTEKGYKTQGDNNNHLDPFNVQYESIVGKLWRVEA